MKSVFQHTEGNTCQTPSDTGRPAIGIDMNLDEAKQHAQVYICFEIRQQRFRLFSRSRSPFGPGKP